MFNINSSCFWAHFYSKNELFQRKSIIFASDSIYKTFKLIKCYNINVMIGYNIIV